MFATKAPVRPSPSASATFSTALELAVQTIADGLVGRSTAFEHPPVVPHDGPQRAFLDSDADIVVYGGGAGGGKTWGLLLAPLYRGDVDVPRFGAVVFRRTYPDIFATGSLWDEAQMHFPDHGAVFRQTPLPEARFPSGATIRFSHMEREADRLNWKGSQIPYIAFDQLEEFTEGQFFYLMSRNRSTAGVRPYMRATVNPDPDSWVKRLLAPWVDEEHPEYPFPPGELRWLTRDEITDDIVWVDAAWRDADGQPARSITYIPATIYDNPTLLTNNPEYLAALRTMPRVDRARLLDSDWSIREAAGFIDETWFEIVDEAPAGLDLVGRSWDIAGTQQGKGRGQGRDPDWTAGPLVGFKDGVWYIADLRTTRATAKGVDDLMDQVAALDGPLVPILLQQDPGEAGKRAVDAHKRRLTGHAVRSRPPTGDKVQRARILASAAEAGNVKLVRYWPSRPADEDERREMLARASEWIRAFLAEVRAFPEGTHDDRIDAVSWGMLMLSFPDEKKAKHKPMPKGFTPDRWFKAAGSDWLRGSPKGGP